MVLIIGCMLAGAIIAMLGFMLTHRRRTPYLHLPLDDLPSLHDGLQTLAGLTRGETFVWTAGEVERQFVDLLCSKAQQGVKVRLLIDALGGSRATPARMQRLGNAGVELNEYCRPAWWNLRRFNHRTHRKVLIVDGIWSHVGSTNFDARSLALNEEVGVGILDEAIAAELKAAFNADLRRSSELQLERWRRRPLLARGYSWLAYQLHSQL